jgi:hypothetical protein
MLTMLASLLRTPLIRKAQRPAKRRRSAPLSVESMEERCVMTVHPYGPAPLPETNYFVVTAPSSITAGVPFTVTVTEYAHATGKQVTSGGVTSAALNIEAGGIATPLPAITLVHGTGTATIVDGVVGDMFVVAQNGSITTPKTYVTGTSDIVTILALPSETNDIWSGYVAEPGAGTVTAVGASWIQPTTTGAGRSSIWVGIDGYGGSTVEQLGISTSVVNGATVYTPWIEFYGDQQPISGVKGPLYNQTSLPYVVHAGDAISASISFVPGVGNQFRFQMKDVPATGTGWTYSSVQTMKYVIPERSTVEWIAENPNSGNQALANFGTVTFTGAWATVSGVTGDINVQKNVTALNMSSSQGHTAVSNAPIVSTALGYNEPAPGILRRFLTPPTGESSSFSITWMKVNRLLTSPPVSLFALRNTAAAAGRLLDDAGMPGVTVLDAVFAKHDSSFFDLL